MCSSLRVCLNSILAVLLWASATFAAPPTVTITGVVYEANNVASAGTRVTFRTVGVQTLPDATVVPPTTFTATVSSGGSITQTIPASMVIEVQVGRSQPRTIYTGTTNTTLGALLAAYNPEIPIGNGTGGTTIVSGGESWTTFGTETQVSAGATLYVAPGGAVSSSSTDAVFPAGAASWSALSCVATTAGFTATAALWAGPCTSPVVSTQAVAVSSSVTPSSGAAVSTTASQCVFLKIDNITGTGTSFVNCAIKRTAS